MKRIVFMGDSVTDADRDRLDDSKLGIGYVNEVARQLSGEYQIINRGCSGDRIGDLARRWVPDAIETNPSILSVLIGVNDTWRRFDENDATTAEHFIDQYGQLLSRFRSVTAAQIVLCEPFLIAVTSNILEWREDLLEKIEGIKRLVVEFNADYVAFDDEFHKLLRQNPKLTLAEDGIHPTDIGHKYMADWWLRSSKALVVD